MFKSFCSILSIFIFLLTLCFPALSSQRSIRTKVKDPEGVEQILYKESYALLIGASAYYEGWPKLPGVRGDIKALEKTLQDHGFTVRTVLDPDSAELETVYRKFVQDYGLEEQNRLLFYFAGHGHTIKQKYGAETAYLVPVDAPDPEVNKKSFLFKALPISRIEGLATRIDAKHALFLFDSCFSGAIFSLTRAIPASISHKTSRPVRQFITSGGADEQVPDESIFLKQLILALKGEGDSNDDGYITASELGVFLTESVINYSRNTQHPQYGKIRNPNLDKGDFVFILPKKKDKKKKTIPAMEALVPSPSYELMFWDTIKDSTNPDDFKAYLAQYPDGLFATLAKIRSQGASIEKKTPPLPVKPDTAAEMQVLLDQAAEHIKFSRLTSPPGNNAVDSLRRAWKLKPGNFIVQQKLTLVVQSLLKSGKEEVNNNHFKEAIEQYRQGIALSDEFSLAIQNKELFRRAIVSLLKKQHENERLEMIAQEARDKEAEQKATKKARQDSEKLAKRIREQEFSRLIALADKHIKAYRLSTPADMNALDTLREASQVDPASPLVGQKLELIIGAYLKLGKKHLNNNNFSKAEQHYAKARSIASEFNLPQAQLTLFAQQLTDARRNASKNAEQVRLAQKQREEARQKELLKQKQLKREQEADRIANEAEYKKQQAARLTRDAEKKKQHAKLEAARKRLAKIKAARIRYQKLIASGFKAHDASQLDAARRYLSQAKVMNRQHNFSNDDLNRLDTAIRSLEKSQAAEEQVAQRAAEVKKSVQKKKRRIIGTF